MTISKKSVLSVSLFVLILWGVVLSTFANPPTSPYGVSQNIVDPACAPNSLNCYVASLSIGDTVGNNPDLNGILYTNANGNTTTDSSFTRNATNYETYIGRTYQNTLPGDLTLTLDSLMLEYSTNATPGAYIPGENLVFENVSTNATYTGVYQGFGFSIPQDNISDNTTFNGTGLDDLNIEFQGNTDYIPVPTTFTFTITDKNVPIYVSLNSYSGEFQIGETVIGSNSGATATVVSTSSGLRLDNISGTFQLNEIITGNSSGTAAYNDNNGDLVDVYSYDNGDISGVGAAGRSVLLYNGSIDIRLNNQTGHEIGDQWTVEITTETFYIHIHKISDVSDSISIGPVSITGQTSNTASEGSIFATTPLGNPGDNIIFQNFSGPQPTISGTGVITAVNGNNYGIEMGQGSTYNIGDLAFINNPNGGGALALVSAANTDPITVDMSSGFSINSNILGAGLRGSVFQQTDGTVTGVMGAIDASSVGGRAVMLGSNISSTATNATSFTSQTIDEIIQTVEMNSGDKSILSLTGSQFKLSTTYTSNPNPALESGFMSTFNQSTTLVPAWFVGSNVQKLPSDLGSSGYVLTTDGSGNLSWAAGSGGSNPISINGSTIYSSGFGNTGSYDNNNIFLGYYAGVGATNASYSNFLGQSAGNGATNAYNSNFLGLNAGYGATSASNSNFFGTQAGNGAYSASYSNFLGQSAGNGATNASNSNFLGTQAGNGATGASYSNFLGYNAGASAANAYNSNFFGNQAGYNATYASNSNFLGYGAGNGATSAAYSNFFGSGAGNGAINATLSNFIGANAGYGATDATYSNFIGIDAGNNADNATHSNFLGRYAGENATNAAYSNFIGGYAGMDATNATYSNFIGYSAGRDAVTASSSIFIGNSAGLGDTVDNTGNVDDFSILFGNNTSTGGFENSIALGSYATNTASNQFMIGSTTRPIDTTRINGSASTQCTITTGTGIACTSDERVKTNITDLSSDTLTKLSNVKTVTYNWLQNPTSKTQIGFLAQDLEQYFPELVETDSMGMKSVYYAQMTPILVEAIREMNLKVTNITMPADASSIVEKIIAKLIKADRVETKELCVDDVCVTRDQFLRMVESSGQTPIVTPPTDPTPATPGSLTCTAPQVLNQTGDACIDPVMETPPAETPSGEEPVTPTE